MEKVYYAIMHNRDEQLKLIAKNHQELVEVMTVFGEHHFYMPVTKSCAERLRRYEFNRLNKLLEVQ